MTTWGRESRSTGGASGRCPIDPRERRKMCAFRYFCVAFGVRPLWVGLKVVVLRRTIAFSTYIRKFSNNSKAVADERARLSFAHPPAKETRSEKTVRSDRSQNSSQADSWAKSQISGQERHLSWIKPSSRKSPGPTCSLCFSECTRQRNRARTAMADLSAKDVERANFAFSIYDFDGSSQVDAFNLGDVLRALNTNPTLATIEKLGGTKKKGEKKLKIDEFLPIYSQIKKDKDQGCYEDFLECLKLYDKNEDGTMLSAELTHTLLTLGEKLEDVQVDEVVKDCMDPEDDEGMIPYAPFLKKVLA